MKYKYYMADIFTHHVFGGAQVAVFPDAEGLNNQQMALVAKELNLSETVFLFANEVKASWKMKIFSSLGEINYAGHPIVAAAYVLASIGQIKKQDPYSSLEFVQNSGALNVSVSWKGDAPVFVQYSTKVSSTVDYYTPTETEMASFLGFDSSHIDQKKYQARLVSSGFPYLVVPLLYYDVVRKAKFNYSAWSQSVAPQTAAQEILLFSNRTPNSDSDFSVRLLGPNVSRHDDPPVGTALSAFASYLCSFDHLQKGTYTFAVERGEEATRRSVINLEMDHKGEDELTLRIGGEAVMMAEGVMDIPDL
ncbi:MAG: PhzF family phenazine biosynthesis protein [Methylococcaceae bacterium]